jgi:hypothetical protein
MSAILWTMEEVAARAKYFYSVIQGRVAIERSNLTDPKTTNDR